MLQRRPVSTSLTIVAGVILGVGGAGGQTTWHVDDDAPGDPGPGDPAISDPLEDGSLDHPFDAIQEGIDAATDGDEVRVAEGTYTGLGNKNLDYAGRLITVRSSNGPETCIIDCEQSGRGFYFHCDESSDAIVRGFTITNGSFWPFGGGVCCENAGPTISKCVFVRNTAELTAGAIFCELANPTIVDCRFLGNDGTAIWCEWDSSVTVTDCTFVGNRGHTLYCSLDSTGTITFSGCLITANYGGSVSVGFSRVTAVTDCTVVGNLGGGFGAWWGPEGSRIANCLVSGNLSAGDRGGEHGYGPRILASGSGELAITGCTITRNRSGYGPIVQCLDESRTAISNSILWANNDPDDPQISVGGLGFAPCLLMVSHSDVRGGEHGIDIDDESVLAWNPGNIDSDPLFTSGPSGTWTADAIPDSDRYQISFVDSVADWIPNELVGRFLDANGELGAQWPIIANTATTITTWGPIPGHPPIHAGDEYQIFDYRLAVASPCIDAGCNCAVPTDDLDLDADGDTDEYLPFDLDGEGRFFDDPATPDTGSGPPPIVDMGAYEFGDSDPQPCRGDLDGDRDVDVADLAILLANYRATGVSGAEGDMDCDGDVELTDLAEFLSRYGSVCD